jgi:uracil-DNA glycosylase
VEQIEAVKPKKILVMGVTAARGLLNVRKLGASPTRARWRQRPCLITSHPAAAMRFPQQNERFRKDLALLLNE